MDDFLPSFYEEHSRLIAALRNHDPKEAERVFHRHNLNVMGIIGRGNLTHIRTAGNLGTEDGAEPVS